MQQNPSKQSQFEMNPKENFRINNTMKVMKDDPDQGLAYI